jgi:hypothetical protein
MKSKTTDKSIKDQIFVSVVHACMGHMSSFFRQFSLYRAETFSISGVIEYLSVI